MRKPWTQWSILDAEKILNDSAWGQTQTDTDISEMFWSTAPRPVTGRGAVNQATSVYLRIRFLSAKPIRQALLREMELSPSRTTSEQIKAARNFVDHFDVKYPRSIVIAVNYEGQDGRFNGPVFQALGSAITSTIRNSVYLELKTGQRVFLKEYQPPGGDQLGAKFIFPRYVNDRLFIVPKADEVRFYAEFPGKILVLNMRFKIAGFLYDGVLEY